MNEIGIIQRMMMRRTGGFVIALHEMPAQRLEQFIEALRPAHPVHLDELIKRRKSGQSCAGLFAITIDDGVGNNVRALSQLFHARQWPATFYLPTQYLDTGEPMAFQLWWLMKPLLEKKAPLKTKSVHLASAADFRSFSKKIETMWYRERQESYLPATLELMRMVERELPRGPAPISWKEVRQLGRDGLIRFESHGVSHTAMSALTERELLFEMSHSQEVVSRHSGKPCRHFCYPFGSPESIGPLAPQIARRFYDSAVTMNLGSIDVADPWLLPRIPLYPKNSLLFARTKILLKCATASREKWSTKGSAQGQASTAKAG